jgi:hypothetical protein
MPCVISVPRKPIATISTIVTKAEPSEKIEELKTFLTK